MRTAYNRGQEVGPHQLIFLREVEPYRLPSGQVRRKALFLCNCGVEFECRIRYIEIGHTKSCGCAMDYSGKLIHGLTGTKLYRCWLAMRTRCFNRKHGTYKNYGARGITVYSPWIMDFKAFYLYAVTLSGWDDPTLSLDRINNDGNYEPGNLRWATRETQANNKRKKSGGSLLAGDLRF